MDEIGKAIHSRVQNGCEGNVIGLIGVYKLSEYTDLAVAGPRHRGQFADASD